MTKYQFEIEGETWDRWKDTVPRSTNLDERIRQLIVADIEGRVVPADESGGGGRGGGAGFPAERTAGQSDADADRLGVDVPGDGNTAEQRRAAVSAVYGLLRERGQVSKAELLGEAVEIAGDTYQSESSLWKNCILPALSSIEDVEPVGSTGDWRFVEGGT